MFQDRYVVDKGSDPPAAAALAHGLAYFLEALGENNEVDMEATMNDRGLYYEITLSDPVEEAWLAQGAGTRLRFLAAGKKFAGQASAYPDPFVYEQEKENRSTYFNLRKQMRAAGGKAQDPEWQQQLDNAKPHPDYDYYAKINQLAAISAYNGLVEQWETNQPFIGEQIRLLLALFASSPNPTDAIADEWSARAKAAGWAGKPMASMLQVVNPSMGKGANRPKADALISPGGLEGFWLVEYLRYLGARHAMIPRLVSGSKDRKSYVVEPKQLGVQEMKRLFPTFQETLWASSHIKMDIMAVLGWMEIFLQDQASASAPRLGRQPDDAVQGLWVTTYKNLGSAVAVMNVALLNLPRWLRAVESEADAQRYLAIISEHQRVVRGLDEKHSDAYDLLRRYRDFLSGATLRDFFHFCAGYGLHLLQRLERGQYAAAFTTPNLEELFMAHPDADTTLAPILADPGFQNVATAIRQSTIALQYRKKLQNERLYEIRYDLGGRLLQKSRYNDEFVRELAEFMFRYNQENARIAEQGRQGPRRRNLTTEDINGVIRLVDAFGAPTVAGMLVALGYASEPKSGSAPSDEDQQEEDAPEPESDEDEPSDEDE